MTYNLGDHSLLFKRLSIQLQNNFDSTLTVSDEYNLNLAKCIYKYLHETYSDMLKTYISDTQSESNKLIHTEDISRAYLDYAILYKDITLIPKDSSEIDLDKHIYDRNKTDDNLVESINDITKFNIALWPISDNIIQYVFSDTVITPLSSLEDIAEMQKLLSNIYSFNYEYVPGTWDSNFSRACYTIQVMSKESNSEIICTGLCDLYVERYLRSQNEIRSTSYGHN